MENCETVLLETASILGLNEEEAGELPQKVAELKNELAEDEQQKIKYISLLIKVASALGLESGDLSKLPQIVHDKLGQKSQTN